MMELLRTAAALSILALSACIDVTDRSNRARADQLSREKKYQEAIDEYWRHIDKRLAVKDRPEWENPYLYLLDIGDIHKEQGDIAEALRCYQMAEEKGVKQGYVNDRYRSVADWYEERGRFGEALQHLEKSRDKEPVMFDLMRDRIARRVVKEQSTPQAPAAAQ